MSRFMQREKVKRIITGITFDLKTKEKKSFSFVPAIANSPKDVLAYARKKMETGSIRVLKATYEETSDLYITLTKLFMLKARSLKTGESKNGFVSYTVNYIAVNVTALDLETDELKEETIYTQKKVKDLLTFARNAIEKGNPMLSVVDAEYNPDKDMQGVYVLPVADFYDIAFPAYDGKLSEYQIERLETIYNEVKALKESDNTEGAKDALDAISAMDDEDVTEA